MDNLSEAYLSVYQELDEAQMGPVEMEKPDPAGSYEARRKALKDKAEKIRTKKSSQQEQVDLYDLILSHLLDEGYAETLQGAEAIMVNMSEDWKEEILDEANRGDEYATRNMSPDDARKYKETRRNAEFVNNKPKALRNRYGLEDPSDLNDMRRNQRPKKKPLATSAGYDPKTGKRDINKIPMGKYETMLDKKRNPQRHKGYYG